MSAAVQIAGGHQTDFARAWAREGKGLLDMFRESIEGALADAGVDARDVEAVHVGNFIGELTTGQGHLGGLVVEAVPALAGVRTARHEAACASGSMAALAGMMEVASGHADVVLVLGAELLRNLPGIETQRRLGAAAWVPHELEGLTYPWPELFSQVGEEYARRHGLQRRHLAMLARQAFANARRNPLAQTRGWTLGDASFAEDDASNPAYAPWIRKHDCSQLTDGAACIVLASPRVARGRPATSTIAGWSARTAAMTMRGKLAASRGDAYVFPEARRCILDALGRAGIDVWSLDAIETHDCFTTSAYMAIDHFGITAPGESWRAIEDGTLAPGGRIPLNPSGGLIGLGHPVGATGVRMLLDAHRQVTGRAGACQVEDARRVATLNLGGSVTTTACFVVAST